jgi:geranylgeranyl diphosphate synthase type I
MIFNYLLRINKGYDNIKIMKHAFKPMINKTLKRFLKERLGHYKLAGISRVLEKSIMEFSLRDGKRVRPIFFLLSYLGYSKSKKLSAKVIETSLAFELLHDFLLIHDDIIDNAKTRRGKPTMHVLLQRSLKQSEKIGKDLSIIAGDIIYALAIEAFLRINADQKPKQEALNLFLGSTILTGAGEFIDIINGLSNINDVGLKHIRMNYLLKTAEYTFKAPLACGCILAGESQPEIKKILKIGELLGEAFQINDDLIGIFSESKKIGKSVLSDIIEAKKTLPIFTAYQRSNKQNKAFIKKSLGNQRLKYSDLQKIRKIIIQTGAYTSTLEAIKILLNQAERLIDRLNMNASHKLLFRDYILSFIKT